MLVLSDEKLTLENLGGGAAAELWNAELKTVLENIQDINTSPGTREINLAVKLTPNERRDEIGIEIICKSKLGAQPPFKSAAKIMPSEHGIEANEFVQKQQKFDFESNVTPIRKEETND